MITPRLIARVAPRWKPETRPLDQITRDMQREVTNLLANKPP